MINFRILKWKSSAPSFLTMVLIAALSFGLFACKSTKALTKKANISDVRKLETYLHQSMPFSTLDSKVDFKFTPQAGIGASMKGSIRLKKDSCIILSIQPFVGIEAAKCIITKDSLVMVSRLHKIYAVERLDQSSYSAFLTISALQDILTNRIFVPGDVAPNERKLSRFDLLQKKDASGFRWGEDRFILDFLIDKNNQYSTLSAFRPESKETIKVVYSQFVEAAFGSFPKVVNVVTTGLTMNLTMQISYSKPSFDTSTDFRFEIPAKYDRVSLTDLIKRFQNML